MDFSWTDQAIDDLRRLQGEGHSAAKIAREMSRIYGGDHSRSAMLGKMYRLGIVHRKVTKPKSPRPASVFFTPHLRRMAADQPEPAPPEPMPDPADPAEVPLEQRRTLLELTNETCRYPYGDPHEPEFFFCGSLTADCRAGRPYCSRHERVVYSHPTPVGDAERERRAAHGRWLSRLAARKRAAA